MKQTATRATDRVDRDAHTVALLSAEHFHPVVSKRCEEQWIELYSKQKYHKSGVLTQFHLETISDKCLV